MGKRTIMKDLKLLSKIFFVSISAGVVTFLICSILIEIITIAYDNKLVESCKKLGEIRKNEYANTEFKNFNFEKSCIDNTRCTSSLKKCN